jgi:hypothetical protein
MVNLFIKLLQTRFIVNSVIVIDYFRNQQMAGSDKEQGYQ